MHGFGVQQDYNEAVRWYRKAADKGSPEAQRCIGFLYEGGSGGVQQDYAEAMGWYRKAADQGHVGAQYHVGSMFANGWGVRGIWGTRAGGCRRQLTGATKTRRNGLPTISIGWWPHLS